MVRNAIVQTERGTFAYVQVLFNNNDDQLVVTSKGISMANLVTKMNDMNDEKMKSSIGKICLLL